VSRRALTRGRSPHLLGAAAVLTVLATAPPAGATAGDVAPGSSDTSQHNARVATSADELATVIDGSYFANTKPDFNLAFAQAKYIGALWTGYLSRHHPNRRFITVSPGNTTGTQAPVTCPYRCG
jgi:hypothetical protein